MFKYHPNRGGFKGDNKMGKKIKYRLSKEYDLLCFSNIYQQVNDFLSEKGISSNLKQGWLGKLKGTTRNTSTTYGDIDLEIYFRLPGIGPWGRLCFNLEFDESNGIPNQRKKADNLIGLLAKFNPKNIETGNDKRTIHLSKQHRTKNFWNPDSYDGIFPIIKDYLLKHDIASREKLAKPRKYIQGTKGSMDIEVHVNRWPRWGTINYDIKFKDSLGERKKADNIIALLAKLNPEYI